MSDQLENTQIRCLCSTCAHTLTRACFHCSSVSFQVVQAGLSQNATFNCWLLVEDTFNFDYFTNAKKLEVESLLSSRNKELSTVQFLSVLYKVNQVTKIKK